MMRVDGPRILVLCHEYPPVGGGAGAVCAALAREYRLAGARPVVVTMGFDGRPEHETIDGVELVRVECGRRRREMASPWEALVWARRAGRAVRSLHRRKPFRAVHAHFIMPAGIVARELWRSAGVGYVLTAHGSDVPGFNRERLKLAHVLARPWWRRICRDAAGLVAPSHSLRTLWERKLPDRPIRVVPHGFSLRFRPLPKERRILLCSRLVERKGFQHFLAALAGLDLPGWEVDLVGDGPMRHRLEALAARCRVPIRFHGWVEQADPRLADLYGRAAIFVFPSAWENFSMALLEGMGAGCAVITTDVSGNPEVAGDACRLTRPGDVAGLGRAVRELATAEDLRRQLGRRAAVRARSFDWRAIAGQYLELMIPEWSAKPLPRARAA